MNDSTQKTVSVAVRLTLMEHEYLKKLAGPVSVSQALRRMLLWAYRMEVKGVMGPKYLENIRRTHGVRSMEELSGMDWDGPLNKFLPKAKASTTPASPEKASDFD